MCTGGRGITLSFYLREKGDQLKVFVVHRTPMRKEAKSFLSSLAASHCMFLEPFFLRKSYGAKWKQQAADAIYDAEVIIVYDVEACGQSDNTKWEIDRAKEIGKEVVELSRENIKSRDVGALQSAYNFGDEFDSCFDSTGGKPEYLIDMYKIMVSSSEELIQRRQITNGFFITIIGAIIGASGFVIKEKIITDSTALVLVLPIAIGLLMCRSWGNLVENYGKLNAGKFKVIHKLERQLKSRIFEAEWVALGKGLRKEKYQSFTSTERNVPTLFSYLLWAILAFILISANWKDIGDKAKFSWRHTTELVVQVYEALSPESDPPKEEATDVPASGS
jgi:hypothetical protein